MYLMERYIILDALREYIKGSTTQSRVSFFPNMEIILFGLSLEQPLAGSGV